MKMVIIINIFVLMFLPIIYGGISHTYGRDQCGDSCSNAAQSQECMCRTYTFAFTVVSPWTFMNSSTGEVYGPAVELVKYICETAGKLCRFAGVDLLDCWDGENSNVLKGRWYDACAVLPIFPSNLAKYDFMEHGMADNGKAIIWARPGSNITAEMLRMPHDFHLGFFGEAGQTYDMLDGYADDGYFIKEKNIIYIQGDVNTVVDQLSAQLNCGSNGNQIDFLYMTRGILPPGNFTLVAEVNFDFGQINIMVRKDEQCLKKWFDEVYEKVICSDEYPAFCQDLTESTVNRSDFCQDRNEICS